VKKHHILFSIPMLILLMLGAGFNPSVANSDNLASIEEGNSIIAGRSYDRVNISPHIISEDISSRRNVMQPIFRIKIKY